MTTRRSFLAGAAGALAAASLPGAGQAQTAPPEKKLGWALVGIGTLSRNQLLPALKACKNSRLAAIVTGHPEKNKPILAEFGLPETALYTYETYDQIAKNPDVDVIYIVLPNSMHAEYVIRGAKAGKHIFCEKPMANTSADCQTMIDACKAAGKKLGIGYRCQYEPFNKAAIDICRKRPYGKMKLIIADHGFNISPGHWRTDKTLAGGGPLMDIGIYSLNACRYLTGEDPVEVTAQAIFDSKDPRFNGIEESLVWTMKFPSGVLATCTTSYSAAGMSRYRVMFEHGAIDAEPATPYHGIHMRTNAGVINQPDVDQFVLEMDAFSQSVMNDSAVITPGEEGLKDMKVIEAIYKAARTGERVKV